MVLHHEDIPEMEMEAEAAEFTTAKGGGLILGLDTRLRCPESDSSVVGTSVG